MKGGGVGGGGGAFGVRDHGAKDATDITVQTQARTILEGKTSITVNECHINTLMNLLYTSFCSASKFSLLY